MQKCTYILLVDICFFLTLILIFGIDSQVFLGILMPRKMRKGQDHEIKS